jgi:hypothetical protein
MKSFLVTLLTLISFGFLVGCASDEVATQQPAAQPAGVANEAQTNPGDQAVDVKSPDAATGQTSVQNPGTSGAAKAINPVVQ